MWYGNGAWHSGFKTIQKGAMSSDGCPLEYWEQSRKSQLYRFAREELFPQASLVASDRVASAIKNYVGTFKTKINDEYLNQRAFLLTISINTDLFYDLINEVKLA